MAGHLRPGSDATTGQYHLHSHLMRQPDLNWRDDEVRAAMLDVLRRWLERGVDGFRIAVAHLLMKGVLRQIRSAGLGIELDLDALGPFTDVALLGID